MNKRCCNSYFNKYKLIKRGIAAENHVFYFRFTHCIVGKSKQTLTVTVEVEKNPFHIPNKKSVPK